MAQRPRGGTEAWIYAATRRDRTLERARSHHLHSRNRVSIAAGSSQSRFDRTPEIGVRNGADDRGSIRHRDGRDPSNPHIQGLLILSEHALATPFLADDFGERCSVQSTSICQSAQNLEIADVFGPAEERLEDGQIEGRESVRVGVPHPRAGLQSRKAAPWIRMPGVRNLKLRRVLVLPGSRLPVGSMIVPKGPIDPILRHQHEAAMNGAELPRELGLQATQPDRRVEAPGSEVVRIDHESEHDAHREAAARPL